ncbi:MAG: hypothetical protein HOD17_09890 [Desulfobacteraceae bacterium]|nr:hypothetical protein [Desulfobacteraceae bacterium]
MKNRQKTGIMADSHGNAETIAGAVCFLKANGCSRLYHLGDICDSQHPETADECITLLRDNDVIAIKGNNDHEILINQQYQPGKYISQENITYLKDLVPVVNEEKIVYAHSLPYYKELGLSCMTRGMGKKTADIYMKNNPKKILFRGHSHSPEIIFNNGNGITIKSLTPGHKTDIGDKIPCIITCGALTRGLCMIFEYHNKTISCVSFQ